MLPEMPLTLALTRPAVVPPAPGELGSAGFYENSVSCATPQEEGGGY